MRMPATCQGCGARVEMRLAGEVVESSKLNNGIESTRALPTAWCEPGTDDAHRCERTNVRAESGQKISGPRAVQPAGDLATTKEP